MPTAVQVEKYIVGIGRRGNEFRAFISGPGVDQDSGIHETPGKALVRLGEIMDREFIAKHWRESHLTGLMNDRIQT